MMPVVAERIATAVTKPPAERRERQALEFPGCRPLRIPREEIADCDIRFEYWDADTEIAMICEPVSYYHERPAARLARLAGLIAAARGAPIEAVGHTDLLVRNDRGERQRIMQADQILFLRPAQAIPRGNAIEVGADALPDVVLEVDNTTDVRRGKLGLYESWGFPEVWVGGAGRTGAEPSGVASSGLDDPRHGAWGIAPDAGQPHVPRLDGGGDTPGAERTGAVGGIRRDPGSGGERAGSSGRDRAGRRSVLAPPAREEPCCRSR